MKFSSGLTLLDLYAVNYTHSHC